MHNYSMYKICIRKHVILQSYHNKALNNGISDLNQEIHI